MNSSQDIRKKPFPLVRYGQIQDPLLGTARGKLGGFGRCSWYIECVAIFTSFSCTAALVAILMQVNDRPLSDWTLPITLNATVAGFITIAKSTATLSIASCISQLKWLSFKKSTQKLHHLDLFEGASRGPSGAAQLLWHNIKRRPDVVAVVGAIATILALGFDTVAQQLLEPDLRRVEVDQRAAFGFSQNYSGGAQSAGGHSYTILDAKDSTADVGMQGAIYKGIFNINSTAVFTCASECIWKDSYLTLGFASNCSDVTSRSTMSNSSADANNGRTPGYHLTTPGGIPLVANYSETDYQTVVDIAADSIIYAPGQSTAISAEFVRIGVLKAPVIDEVNSIIDPATLQAFECTVAISAYNYSEISANGSQFTIGHQEQITLNPGTLMAVGEGVIAFNQTGLPPMIVGAPDVGALQSFFKSDRFSGSIYDGEGAPTGPRGVGAALLNADVEAAFEAMTQSMTAYLRSTNGSSSAIGSTIKPVTFIRVRWIYLVFLLFVQVLSGFLLAVTWHGSSSHRVNMWKASTVAILCHDLVLGSGSVGTICTDIKSPEQLKELAKQVTAKLE